MRMVRSDQILHVLPKDVSLKIPNSPKEYVKRTTHIIQPIEILERLRLAGHKTESQWHKAFYSSEFGGITTEAAFMVIHADDHIVHRGHSVSDVSLITQGHIYLLDRNLDRFFKSADALHIKLPFPKQRIRKIIIDTCTASRVRDGEVRFWLSSGRGGFGVTTKEKRSSSLYVRVNEYEQARLELPNFTERWRIITSSITVKNLATEQFKSNEYHLHALCLKEAEDQNAQHGIFLDSNGFVMGGAGLDFLLYTGDRRLVAPVPDNYDSNCLIYRILELVNKILINDTPDNVKDYEWVYDNIKSAGFVSPMRPCEIRNLAKELFLVGNDIVIIPVFQWDEEWVGERFIRTSSELFQVLGSLIKQDMNPPGHDNSLLTRLPYLE